MLNVNELIKKAIKKEIYPETNVNAACRQVLSELKTKFVDFKEEITTEIQYKILKKMLNERNNSKVLYEKIFAKEPENKLAEENLNKADSEILIIVDFIAELEKEMPKKLTESEIEKIISDNQFKTIGECMSFFKKNYTNQDNAMIAKVFNKMK